MKMIKKIAVVLVAMVMMLSMAVPAFAAGAKTNLVSMHELESDDVRVIDDGITDSYGKSYSSNILRFSTGDDAFITYDLNGQYESFEGSIVCGDRTGSGAVMSVGIYADGEKVYELKGYTRQKAAESFNIDVSGVGELSIKTTKTDGYDGYLYFVESTFTKADTARNYPNRSELSDLVVIDSKACTVSDRLLVDVFGNVHNGWTRMNSGDKGYVLFNLDKKYVSLTGSIVTTDRTGNNAVMDIEFFLDDKPVYSKMGITRTTNAIDFSIDVSNASVLKITTSKSDGLYGYIYVVDSVLKAHEHSPADWTVQTEATCTEDGEKVQICKDCGETVATEKIPATGHTADTKWTVTTEATCTEKGERIHKCTVCGEAADKEAIEAKGHTANGSWEYGDDGTCNKVQKCTVCGDVALRQTDEEAEHTLSGEWTITREARCDAEGERVQYCTICNEVGLAEAIPTTEHDYGKWATISGSVWNNPIVKERTCSICGDVEHVESNSTSWLKPLVIVLFVIIFGGLAVIIVTLKMNGLALEPASIKKLFSKESLTDDDIDDILNKPDDNSDNQ